MCEIDRIVKKNTFSSAQSRITWIGNQFKNASIAHTVQNYLNYMAKLQWAFGHQYHLSQP